MGLKFNVPTRISDIRNVIKTSELFPIEPEVNIIHARDGNLNLLELRFLVLGVLEFMDRGAPLFSLCTKSPSGPCNPPLTDADSSILPRRQIQ